MLIVLAAVVFALSRWSKTIRWYGRPLHRPGLWTSVQSCVGVAMLLGAGEEYAPDGWHSVLFAARGVLLVAGLVMAVSYLVSLRRVHRRPDPRGCAGPRR